MDATQLITNQLANHDARISFIEKDGESGQRQRGDHERRISVLERADTDYKDRMSEVRGEIQEVKEQLGRITGKIVATLVSVLLLGLGIALQIIFKHG